MPIPPLPGDAAGWDASVRHQQATRALLESLMAQGYVPGGVAAVGRGNAAPYIVKAGTIAFEDATHADADTLWRIYSMTKPVTGMAAMLLIHEGVISLDQPLADFFPDFTDMRVLTDPRASLATRPALRAITVRHLLTHTAGFGYTLTTTGPLLAEYRRLGICSSRRSRSDAPSAPSLREFCVRLAGYH